MSEWLLLHGYFLTAFDKFGSQTEPLSQYASDIVAPFLDGGWDQFPKWYKACTGKIPHVRFITDSDSYTTLDGIMRRHLEDNILGDEFDEDTIVRVPSTHLALGQTEMVLKYTLEFLELLEA